MRLLIVLMLANGAVNLFQFRMRQHDIALGWFLPYWVLLIVFLVVVWPIDWVTAALFSAYAAYQPYAAVWGYWLWRLNRKSR